MTEQAPNIENLSGSGRLVYDKARRTIVSESKWQPIETAPKDGTTIFAEHWQTGQRGMVHFNSQGEWEMVNGLNNTPMGVGFYPTHWQPLPAPPSRVQAVGE